MADPISYYVEILNTNKKGKVILGYVPSQDNIEELDIAATKRHMRVIGERFADSINDNIRIYKPSSNKSAYFVFKGNVENPLSPMQDGSIASVNFGLLTRLSYAGYQLNSIFQRSALAKTLDKLVDF